MDPSSIAGALLPSLISNGLSAAFGGGQSTPAPQIAPPQAQQKPGIAQLTNVDQVGGQPFGFGGTLRPGSSQPAGTFIPATMPSPQVMYNRGLLSNIGPSMLSELTSQITKGFLKRSGESADKDKEDVDKQRRYKELLDMLEKMKWG